VTIPPKDPDAPERPLDVARRHVAEAEARIARLHQTLRGIDADKHPDAAAAAQQVLVTMEATLSVMRDHLLFEERRQAQQTDGGN
jgi:hypothetical protein